MQGHQADPQVQKNGHLSQQERIDALVLSKSIVFADELIGKGERNTVAIISGIIKMIDAVNSSNLDYVKIVDANKILLIVLADDIDKLGLFLKNGFDIGEAIFLPVSQSGYKKAYVLVSDCPKQY